MFLPLDPAPLSPQTLVVDHVLGVRGTLEHHSTTKSTNLPHDEGCDAHWRQSISPSNTLHLTTRTQHKVLDAHHVRNMLRNEQCDFRGNTELSIPSSSRSNLKPNTCPELCFHTKCKISRQNANSRCRPWIDSNHTVRNTTHISLFPQTDSEKHTLTRAYMSLCSTSTPPQPTQPTPDKILRIGLRVTSVSSPLVSDSRRDAGHSQSDREDFLPSTCPQLCVTHPL